MLMITIKRQRKRYKSDREKVDMARKTGKTNYAAMSRISAKNHHRAGFDDIKRIEKETEDM